MFEFRNKHGDLTLDDTMALHYLDLTKFDKDKPKNLCSRFERWLHILKFGERYVNIKKRLSNEEGVLEVVAEIRKINADDEKRQLM